MTVGPQSIVVVGGGHAGGAIALSLRENGATGDIVIVGEEPVAPYERPALSKEMLLAQVDAPVPLASPERWPERGIALRLATKVAAIDRTHRCVLLEDDSALPYDVLILATGGTARSISGSLEAGAFTLRTVADAESLRSRARISRSALILGGGLIGLEVAASLRQAGLEVDLVGADRQVAARSFPRVASDWIADAHVKAGVRLHLGSRVTALRRAEGGIEAQLANGQHLVSDLVILGLGIEPNSRLAADAGLPCNGGILVDEDYRTLGDRRIFAIGDIAERSAIDGVRPSRDESWSHARRSAAIAARAILALPPEPEEAPWFWTSQFGHMIQVAGTTDTRLTAVRRGPGVMLYLDGNRLAGIACLDTPRDFLAGRRAIASGQGVDVARAADPATDLRKCFFTHMAPHAGVMS
ncbi:hypothetical protein BV98_002760 [Sphingobium herbicidovorans NBRC 16415]|uniref:Uncharacterized protein n=1 Tax=Sphingobium herbicidovorans (strain ATCC 700291 / DSM 11019 / CCUG 56400 / KCTC 2939 / LMG 18315 / NBRC 16415 / MH) TaxID=1219045 RepID=A0A086P7X8_SPHHM|nr:MULTISPECIES: FAD-dependent oxidoreductase [Sphingomonadaceae]AGU69348.1 putative oxidoreductase component CadD of Rieske non-heme iron oxygenase CadABCD complex [Sphingomonas sp. ERG5]KFG89496.1 hypothetical protein BV98_002760 [Sphingobium herbicidovorans NBRC 16415]